MTTGPRRAGSIEWATPDWLFSQATAYFGPFDLDVCASAENAKCPRYFDQLANGLEQLWAPARCWMNPPWSRHIPDWLEKAETERRMGATVVGLLPVRTDTAWWQDHVHGKASTIYLIRGRVTFDRPGQASRNGRDGAAIVLWDFTPPSTAYRRWMQP